MAGAEPTAGGALVWFRRDLRDNDHAALHAALESHRAVHCAFLFDIEILGALESNADRRVTFIWQSVRELKAALEARGGGLHLLHGRARDEIPRLARRLGVAAVYANRDYEPLAIERDSQVAHRLWEARIDFRTRKDQVIFELDEVRTRSGDAFSVFTPYKKAWLAKLEQQHCEPLDMARLTSRLAPAPAGTMPTLKALRFERAELPLPAAMSGGAWLWKAFRKRLAQYKRDVAPSPGTRRWARNERQ